MPFSQDSLSFATTGTGRDLLKWPRYKSCFGVHVLKFGAKGMKGLRSWLAVEPSEMNTSRLQVEWSDEVKSCLAARGHKVHMFMKQHKHAGRNVSCRRRQLSSLCRCLNPVNGFP